MTAEVAILNTHGIALATDSAVTISVGGEKKVYNTANKLFMLSKHHPVGIMIYNKATYMEIDWEIIIKEFRKSIKSNPCDKLSDYANKFINYVKEFIFITEEQQKDTLFSICYNIILLVRNSFFHEINNKFGSGEDITSKQVSQIFNSLVKNILTSQKGATNKVGNTIDISFIEQHKNKIYGMMDMGFEKYKISTKQKENLLNIIISDLTYCNNINNFTGIVIAGYGDKEIFPSLYQCKICGKIGNSFILFDEEQDNISYENTATIMPFAQREMVHTFMSGIDPIFQTTINKELNNFVMSIADVVGNSYKEKLIQVKDEFTNYLKDFKQKVYINPIMSIVKSLQKEDLAEMAETLVNLTAFKRHISKDAETVGGPTDVAVITKGDGFIWIKRKHYFDIKLNRDFLKSHFEEDISNEGL